MIELTLDAANFTIIIVTFRQQRPRFSSFSLFRIKPPGSSVFAAPWREAQRRVHPWLKKMRAAWE